jgi:hypothetical protein
MTFASRGQLVRGLPAREPRVNLGPVYANAYWQFTLTGTNTPATVYQDGNLTTPFSSNQVPADATGRFPAIYLDPNTIYRAQLFSSAGVLIRGPYDNYQSAFSTSGSSQAATYGVRINAQGEISLVAPGGGHGNTLTAIAAPPGGASLRLNGPSPGSLALEIDNSATTGAQVATFAATNKPGIATSAPVAWLPIRCDGQIYYTPLWRGDAYVPIIPVTQQVVGQTIVCATVTFNGDGTTTLTGSGASASPPSWYTPPVTGIGSGYWINCTKTGGAGTFSAANGVWTNIGSGGLTIGSTPGTGPVNGTYQLSTSNTGSPVVANGTISCTFTPVLRAYNTGSGTETIPTGATTMVVEQWGGAGPGGAGFGSFGLDTAEGGGGGQAGGYCRSSYTVSAQNGHTLNWSVGAGGTPPSAGGASTITAGTMTGFTAMTANGGNPGGNASSGIPGTGGSGAGAATGGNAANITGASGQNGSSNNSGGQGGTGTTGTVAGDGSPHSSGGIGAGQAGAGFTGQVGYIVFYYT